MAVVMVAAVLPWVATPEAMAIEAPVTEATAVETVAGSVVASGSSGGAERPDRVSAGAAAVSSGREVLITGETTPRSLTWARPDGSLRSEITSVPVRVRQGDGGWADVDYTLVEVPGGWSPRVSATPLVFTGGGSRTAVTLAASGEAGAQRVGLEWDGRLPAPSVEGPTATYDLGRGRSLVLTAVQGGFEQSLVLRSAPAPGSKEAVEGVGLPLPLQLHGLSVLSVTDAVGNTTGGYRLADAAGETVFDVSPPVVLQDVPAPVNLYETRTRGV